MDGCEVVSRNELEGCGDEGVVAADNDGQIKNLDRDQQHPPSFYETGFTDRQANNNRHSRTDR